MMRMASVAALEPQLILKLPFDFSTHRGCAQLTKTLAKTARKYASGYRRPNGWVPMSFEPRTPAPGRSQDKRLALHQAQFRRKAVQRVHRRELASVTVGLSNSSG